MRAVFPDHESGKAERKSWLDGMVHTVETYLAWKRGKIADTYDDRLTKYAKGLGASDEYSYEEHPPADRIGNVDFSNKKTVDADF